MGTYGTDYEQRAAIAFCGLGANLREDQSTPPLTMTRKTSL